MYAYFFNCFQLLNMLQSSSLLFKGRPFQVLWRGEATSLPVDCHRTPKVGLHGLFKKNNYVKPLKTIKSLNNL